MKVIKESCKLATNILLFIDFIIMILAAWLDLNILAVMTITLGTLSIGVSILAAEECKLKVIIKDLNLYFFLVSIIVGISVLLINDWLLYIAIALFFLVLVFYVLTIFFDDKSEKEKGNKKVSKEDKSYIEVEEHIINQKPENQKSSNNQKPVNKQQKNKKKNNNKKKK